MNKFLMFLFLLLMAFQCQSNRPKFKKINISDFKNIKLKVDTSIKSKSLKLINKVSIEETPYLVLKEVNDVQFNPDTNQILIIDITNRTANLYDYNTGKIINWIKAKKNLSDSVAYSKWKDPPPSPFQNFKKFRFLKLKEYNNYGITDSDINRFVTNRFIKVRFIDNYIYLATLACVSATTKDTFNTLISYPIMVICNDKLQILRTIEFELLANSYPSTSDFIYNKKTKHFFLCSSNSARSNYYHLYDSSIAISEYSEDGDFIKVTSFLPKLYSIKKIGNSLYQQMSFTAINNKVLISLPFDEGIYEFNKNIYNKKLFDLYNLPITNDSGLAYYHKISLKMHDMDFAMTGQENYRIMTTLFPIRIVHTFNANNNIGIQIIVFDSTKTLGYYYIIQEYTIEGKLQNQTNIYDNPDNRIKYITFDNKNKYLVIIKKSKKVWTLEKRQWL